MAEVSMICSTYDRVEKLFALVQSLLVQTMTDWELLIFDEGNQNVRERLKEQGLLDARVRTWGAHHTNDWGYTAKDVAAKNIVESPFVCFTNDDCIYTPDFFEKMLAAAYDARADFVYCDMILHKVSKTETFVTEPKMGRIDIGAFIIRTNVFKELNGFEDKGAFGDGVFVERVVRNQYVIVKVPLVMYEST